MDQFSGGNWGMIPNEQGHGNFGAPANQDHLFLQQQPPPPLQQFHHQQQQQFQPQDLQFQQFQQQQYQQQSQQFHQQQQQQQQQRMLQSPPLMQSPPLQAPTPPPPLVQTPSQMQMQPPPQHQHQSLASHFHLYPLVEKLADAIETGTRDPNSDALVSEMNSHFEKCQQLLNSISGSLGSKTMTVDGQKRKLEESEQLLEQRRELIAKYKTSVEDLIKSDP
ncbi:PREDICTED: mediator of RNA polymerase II transcription subunit 9 [Tarenaya hassleriana]|uniref:mediator of RNA polymerase II transcription subunit 9 n=1 Tax=Tarenaya hassleriana TaxID=28532 RepID=UPI00053C8E1B|nr:PREDICTED: mediator of RNA polymerase II transcription subunit 9 [Tarenaya hassleriana]XP_010552216.1 PREDICTED: mediator of RNA polymerase II transcription subunit 9 [Tarenaya hassleriana]